MPLRTKQNSHLKSNPHINSNTNLLKNIASKTYVDTERSARQEDSNRIKRLNKELIEAKQFGCDVHQRADFFEKKSNSLLDEIARLHLAIAA